MKSLFLVVLFSSIAFAQLGTVYQSNFPLTENPISESGNWINGGTTGISWGNVQTTPGEIFGVSMSSQFGDPTAILSGTWSPNQIVQTVVKITSQPTICCHELENRLLSTITANVNKGYEINYSAVPGNKYIQLVRWNGALSSFVQLDQANPATAASNGDVFTTSATVSGSTVTFRAWVNGNPVTFTNCSCTAPTDSGASAILSGAPGVGFYDNQDTNWSFFGFSSFLAVDAAGKVAYVPSPSSTNLNSAISTVGSTARSSILVAPGSATWSSTVNWSSAPADSLLVGSGTCSGTPASSCNDTTLITCTTTGETACLDITTSNSGAFRMTGMSFLGSGTSSFNGVLRFSGRSQSFRIDHTHFKNLSHTALVVNGPLGVRDHIVAEGLNNDEFDRPLQGSYGGVGINGDNSWASATNLGSNQALYLEDSTISGVGQQGMATNDCFTGGRYVVRFNNMIDTSVQGHTTGHAGDDRGCRLQEVYKNNYLTNPGGIIAFNSIDLESGSGVVWGNTVTSGQYSNFMTAHIKRESNSTYTQVAPPSGWGYCGSNQNGSTSAWDQNSIPATGYACLDQIGRGQGDLLQGLFPSKCNVTLNPSCNTFTGQWPRQNFEPFYEWSDTWACASCGGSFLAIFDPGIVQDRDIYLGTGSFNGTSGVGTGTLASRPATCTTGVAYFATDQGSWNSSGSGGQGVLYKCTSTDTWTAYYTPYTYPHPLATGSSSVPSSPGVQLSPLAGFGTQKVGTTSSNQIITVTSNGTLNLTITSIAKGGTNAADFAMSHNCPLSPSVLSPPATCQITVSFTPSATGARSATVTVSSNAPTSPDSAPLSGTGTAPAVSISPASKDFGSVQSGTSSGAFGFQLSNTGDATLTITSKTITGTDLTQFSVSTSTCGATLSPSNSCSISVVFSPTSIGAKSATLSVVDDASGSPHTATLTGTGTSASGPTTTIGVSGAVSVTGGISIK